MAEDRWPKRVSLVNLPSTATIPVTGSLSIGSAATLAIQVTNTVAISSAATIPITGSLSVGSAATLPVTITNAGLPSAATLAITGSLSVGSAATLPVTVTNTVGISSAATIPITGSLSVGSAATLPVTITNAGLPSAATLAITGSLSVGSAATLPVTVTNTVAISSAATIPITGSLSVGSAATLPVTITNAGLPSAATLAITGSLSVGSAATLPVTITNAGLPSAATLAITGSLSIGSAATLAVVIRSAATSDEIPVVVNNTATVIIGGPVSINNPVPLGVSATIPVSVSSAATLPITHIAFGTASTGIVKVEDGSHFSGDSGVFILAIRNTTSATETSNDQDYSPISVDEKGYIIISNLPSSATIPITGSVAISSAATIPITGLVQLGVSATVPVSVSSAATLAVFITNTGLPSGATLAFSSAATLSVAVSSAATLAVNARGRHVVDAAFADSPMGVAGVAVTPTDATATMTVSANGDVVAMLMDRNGAVFVLPHGPQIWRAGSEYTITAGATDVTVKAAAATGLSYYVGSVFMNWQSANSATVRPYISIGTGAASVIVRGYQATSSHIAPVQMTFNPPMKLTASTAIHFSSTATEAGVAIVKITGYTAP